MQERLLTLLKHVGSLMRLFKLYDVQSCSKNKLETSVFKLSRIEEQYKNTLKNRNQFPYQYSANDQLLNLYLDCINMIGAISSILS